MSELVIAEKSDLVGIADEVRQLTGQTKSLSLQEMQTGLKSIDNKPDWHQNDSTASDYIKNRPGGYTVNYPALNIEWDGVIGDRVSVDYKRTKFVKVSDETPAKEQIAAGRLTYLVEGEQKIADDLGGYVNVGVGCIWVAEFVIVINQPGIVADNLVFPETGTYFVYNDENSRAVSLALRAKSVIVRIPGELTNIVGGYVREEGKEPLVDAVVLAGCFKLYEGDK